jgi:hypothetical protein
VLTNTQDDYDDKYQTIAANQANYYYEMVHAKEVIPFTNYMIFS